MPPQLLDELDAETKRRVLQSCRRARYAAGAFIFHAGDAGESIYLIESGRVSVLAGGELGDPVMLDLLGRGDFFGELALLNSAHRRTATIQALAPTEVLILQRRDFEELRRIDPGVDRFLIAMLARKVAELTEQMVEAVEISAPTRIYRRLNHLGRLFDVTGSDHPIPVSQVQLASMAGTKLRVTNAVLAIAKKDGVVDVGRKRIIVLDWPELSRRARLRAG